MGQDKTTTQSHTHIVSGSGDHRRIGKSLHQQGANPPAPAPHPQPSNPQTEPVPRGKALRCEAPRQGQGTAFGGVLTVWGVSAFGAKHPGGAGFLLKPPAVSSTRTRTLLLWLKSRHSQCLAIRGVACGGNLELRGSSGCSPSAALKMHKTRTHPSLPNTINTEAMQQGTPGGGRVVHPP